MIRGALFHCRGDAQRFVNAAKVVEREPQRVCGLQILPFLAEGIREPRQPPHSHAERKILTFNMRRADESGIGIAHDWDRLRTHDFRGVVPLLPVPGPAVDLDESREVGAGGPSGFGELAENATLAQS